MKLRSWNISDTGKKRDHNEDSLLDLPHKGLFVVADGMGGHKGGDQASRLAVEILLDELEAAPLGAANPSGPGTDAPPALYLQKAAKLASRTIYDIGAEDEELQGMGTTLTSLLFHGGRAYLGHVGDSRAYLFRDNRIEQLTEDHSWIEEQVKAGLLTPAEAVESSLKHVITRSVGYEPDVIVDLVVLPFLMGDCFLLCSDGLSSYISDDELRQILCEEYYCQVPELVVELANERGGDDNITCVIIYVANDGMSEAPAVDDDPAADADDGETATEPGSA